jgi:putative hemolysin
LSSWSLWNELIALVLLMGAVASTSAALGALPKLNRGRLRHLSSEGSARAKSLLSIVEDSSAVETSISAANLLSVALASVLGTVLIGEYFGSGDGAIPAIALAALVLLLWVELASRAVGATRPEAILFSMLAPLKAVHLLMQPLTYLTRLLTGLVFRGEPYPAGGPMAPDDPELRMIADAEEEGILQDEEREMIHGIVELGERTAREIMVPRVDVVAVPANDPLREVFERINARGHSRIPIYEESIDNVVGIVYAKDLLRHMEAKSLDEPSRSLGRPPHFIPESKKIDELLHEMQRDKVHMAIVVDEYGGTAGVITIEDLLEEIVGEIQDEYDVEEKSFELVGEHEGIFDARVTVREVNEALDVVLEEGEYDTVGGLVYDRLGKIPVVGDVVQVDGMSITVLSTAGKRIKKVKVLVTDPEAPERVHGG